jgi:hypothetical protein
MRSLADRERIGRLIQAIGNAAEHRTQIYLLGGTTAVLMGWRSTTVDVDFVMRPEDDAILRALPGIKETLQINIETASPLVWRDVFPCMELCACAIAVSPHPRKGAAARTRLTIRCRCRPLPTVLPARDPRSAVGVSPGQSSRR